MKRIIVTMAGWFIAAVAAGQINKDTIPLFPDHYLSRIAGFKKEAVTKEKTLFLGDGFIESGNWRKLLRDSSVINQGIRGDIASAVLQRITYVISRHPSKVFLLVGEDDLYKKLPDETVIEFIFTIANRIKKGSPGTSVFVQSILPVNPTMKTFPGGHDHAGHADVINAQLKKYAEKIGYTYVDLYAEFMDDRGHLAAVYSNDGLNLTAAGYTHWIEVLKQKKFL